MKFSIISESIEEQDVLTRIAERLSEVIRGWWERYVEIIDEVGNTLSAYHISRRLYKEMGLEGSNGKRFLGKICGKGVMGKYYKLLGYINFSVAFDTEQHDDFNGIYDPYGNFIVLRYFQPMYGNRTYNANYVKSVLVHELRHALDHKLRKEKAFKYGTNGTREEFSGYYGTRHEVWARATQAMMEIKKEVNEKKERLTGEEKNNELNRIVLTAMDKYKLMHIFKSDVEYAQDEDLIMFGRGMPRSYMTLAPHDNKYFRKLYNRLYLYAVECLNKLNNGEKK